MPKRIRYTADAVIYMEGEEQDKIFLLEEGRVLLRHEDMETGKQVEAPVQTGEFFGLKSALGHYPREETARTGSPTSMLLFTTGEFEELALKNIKLIMKMLRVFSTEIRYIHKKLASVMKAEVQDPENGLYSLGAYLFQERRYDQAKYVFRRYMTQYPAGEKLPNVKKMLHDSMMALPEEEVGSLPPSHESAAGEGFARFARTFNPNEFIFAEFELGETFYFIQSGEVELVKLIGGVEKKLDTLKASEMFGEMALLENSPRSATAIAGSLVEVLEFNRQNFDILMEKNPHIALKLLKILVKRIYEAKQRFMILTLPEPAARVAAVLVMLEKTQPNSAYQLTPHREITTSIEDIGRWAALSSADAKEAIYYFVEQGRIEVFEKKIVVHNINDLIRYSHSHRRRDE